MAATEAGPPATTKLMPGTADGAKKARAARRRKKLKRVRANATLDDLLKELTRAMRYTRDVLRDAADDDTRLKAVHALHQTASTYARILKGSELEAQVDDLTQRLEALEAPETPPKLRKVK